MNGLLFVDGSIVFPEHGDYHDAILEIAEELSQLTRLTIGEAYGRIALFIETLEREGK